MCRRQPGEDIHQGTKRADGDFLVFQVAKFLNARMRDDDVIGPFDRMSVQVYGIPDMDRSVQADATGRVNFPLVGVIDAAGLTPAQVIRAATKSAAEFLHAKDLGALETGKWADLVVLNADPLKNIRNTRTIQSVYIAGNRVAGGK